MADARDWPEMLIGLYDKLAGGGAEISCSFDGFEVKVPDPQTPRGGEQTLRVTGTIKVAARRGGSGASGGSSGGSSGGGGGGRR